MSKRSEEAAKEIYKDGIKLVGRRDKNNNIIIHPEIMVGILRNAATRGYEQAEKETIERACLWLKTHLCRMESVEEIDLFNELFKNAMEEEQ